MKKELMKTFVIASVLLVASIGTVSADPGVVVDVTPITDTVAQGGTATYTVNVTITWDCTLEPTRNEDIVLLIDDPTSGWGYVFDPNNYNINCSSPTVYSNLEISVPSTATLGDHYHTVNATAYDPIFGWLGVVQFSAYTGVKTAVIPEFSTMVIPVAVILGLFLLIRRRKQ